MADTRLPRLLRVMTLIRAKAGRTIAELAAELEVVSRTVYRDLKALSHAGIPVRFDRESGGYRIDGDFFLPPMQLNLGEAMALSVLASELGHGKGRLPFLDDAWRAITKIRSQLPSAVRDDVAEIGGHVRVEGARVSPQEGNDRHFELIRRAIADKRKVRCVYAAGRSAGKPFLFRPYTLYFGQRAWYAIGLHEERDEERSLKLNRFRAIEPTDRPYGIPDDWTIERCFGKAWRMMKGDRIYQIEIRFRPECAMNVADTLWHPTQTVVMQPDGSCVFRCEVEGLDEIVWWVLGYGSSAEVCRPPELRERIKLMVMELTATYDARGPAGAS